MQYIPTSKNCIIMPLSLLLSELYSIYWFRDFTTRALDGEFFGVFFMLDFSWLIYKIQFWRGRGRGQGIVGRVNMGGVGRGSGFGYQRPKYSSFQKYVIIRNINRNEKPKICRSMRSLLSYIITKPLAHMSPLMNYI